ncbi:APC family permease [Streptacidiphilus pinicola]|uniref:APC family permease n=1 Tax=Streptacidiphilus pinicola TaxID=2219663 RepID=A0A2X0IK28_9ACTN|nr:APC family permease [Streptacidiphilus pinicola]RAG83963.1 APC family permease [Streptacidiphilus pinicola]
MDLAARSPHEQNSPDPDASGDWSSQRRLLRKSLRRVDVFFFLICTLVGLDTIGSVAASGLQGLTWLAILGVVFFLPYGLLVAELGSAFPLEGGPYIWTKLAFGRTVAAVNQVLYWASNPLWVGGTLCVLSLTTFQKFFHPLHGFWLYAAGLIFVWAGTGAVLLSLRVGKWIPTIGAALRILLLTFFTVSVVIHAVRKGVTPLQASDAVPTYAGFISLVPFLIFNYVGFELPSTAAEEMEDPRRDVPFSVLRSGIATVFLYGAPILGILLVVPAKQVSNLGGFIDACKSVFTVYGGSVATDGTVTLTGAGAVLGKLAAVGLIVALLTSGVTWAMGGDRGQAVACADGGGPAWLGKISPRFGTPVRVNMLSGVVASLVMVAALQLTSGDVAKYFSAGLGLAISTTFISYVVTFPALSVLRRKQPETVRPYRVPGGAAGVRVVTWITTGLVAFTVVVLVWPGFGVDWFGTSGDADASLPAGFAGQRLGYTLSQVVPLALLILLGAGFALIGHRRLRRTGETPDHPREVPAAAQQG